MKIALFKAARGSPEETRVIQADVTWQRLAQKLTEHRITTCFPCAGKDCPQKFGPAWSPVAYLPGVTTRGNAGVDAITAAVFDVEGPGHKPLPDEAMAALAERLEGYASIVHSTHSGMGCYRLVLQLSRPVLPSEWPHVHAAIIAKFQIPADPKCGDVSRLYFLPSAPAGTKVCALVSEGKPVDVDSLSAAPPESKKGVPHTTPPSPAPGEQSLAKVVDLDPLRAALRRKHTSPERAELAKKILKGEPLATVGGRDDAVNRAASLLASLAPEGTPREAALMLLEPSIRAMPADATGKESSAGWLAKAGQSYDRALKRANEYRAGLAGADALADAMFGAVPENATQNDWMKDLVRKTDQEGNFKGWAKVSHNFGVIFEHHPDWKGWLRWNTLFKRIEVIGGPLANVPQADLETAAAGWLQRSRFRFECRPHEVGPVLAMIARRNPFDPVRDFLERLPAWDGVERLKNFAFTYLNTNAELAPMAYLQTIPRKFLIGAVARALRPGCEMHNVLILEGDYGAGKSRLVKILSAGFTTDEKLDLADKDSKQLVGQCWLVEMAELAGLRRADSETIKLWMSKAADRYRPPYARVTEEFPRQCVFIGSTNADKYLPEPNRREWPIWVGRIDIEALTRDRDQIWAEALHAFRAGEPWWLDNDQQEIIKMAREQAEQRATTDFQAEHRREQIVHWWLQMEPQHRPEYITGREVAEQACGLVAAQLSTIVLSEIGRAMKSVGFLLTSKKKAGIKLRYYYAPPILRNAQDI